MDKERLKAGLEAFKTFSEMTAIQDGESVEKQNDLDARRFGFENFAELEKVWMQQIDLPDTRIANIIKKMTITGKDVEVAYQAYLNSFEEI